MIKNILIALLLGLMLISSSALAANYYVSPLGTAQWSLCMDINTPCSLATANQNAKAGDTVYLRGGTYLYSSQYASALKPVNSGTNSEGIIAWITFTNAQGEAPELRGTTGLRQWGLFLDGNSYVRIKGISFKHFSDSGLIRHRAHHIEVTNCSFRDGGGFQMVEGCTGGSPFNCYVSHLWIHNNTFSRLAAGGGCSGARWYSGDASCCEISEGGDAVRVGYPPGTCARDADNNLVGCTEGGNHHITIDDNLIEYAGHAVMDHYSTETVVRNNIMHNEPWYPENNTDRINAGCDVSFPASGYLNPDYDGYYSHRNYQATDAFGRDATHNLIEGNRIGHAGVNPNNDGADNMDLASPKNIFRYNSLYNAMNNGLMFKYGPTGHGASGGINNRVYSNTIYHNGWGYPYYETCKLSTCPEPLLGIRFYYPTTSGNIIKNNIVYGSRSYYLRGHDIRDIASNTILNNFLTQDGDPRFVNPDLTQPASSTLPDLKLHPDSPAIDGGVPLTYAKGAGANSLILVMDDALYFQDGTWGSDLTRGVTLFPDWIAIGSINNIVQVKSIDYATNTTTLASPMTWKDGAPVWLYRKSDGQRVLYGSAPDIGAYEYSGIVSPSVPGDLNGDGLVNSDDFFVVVADFGKSGGLVNPRSDVNLDGRVDIADLVFVARRYTG